MHEQAVADHSHLTMHLGSPFGAQAANDVSRLNRRSRPAQQLRLVVFF